MFNKIITGLTTAAFVGIAGASIYATVVSSQDRKTSYALTKRALDLKERELEIEQLKLGETDESAE